MKQIGLRYLYKHLGEALKAVPFEITNHNKVVAIVIPIKKFKTADGKDITTADVIDDFKKTLKLLKVKKNV